LCYCLCPQLLPCPRHHSGLCWASPSFPSSFRCPTAAPDSLACCVSRAQGVWEVCAQATGSARTGSWAVGSAAAMRAFMERPVRCVNWAATGLPALEVRLGKGSMVVPWRAEQTGHPGRGRG
jgi:hypothetical protein